jgi:hypothetical protein
MKITRCVSCDGYGWFIDDFTNESTECDWCKGVGYVYRDAQNIDHPIPDRDYGKVADQLEQLEQHRMQDMGYSGEAKKPWEQAIREGRNPLRGDNPEELV